MLAGVNLALAVLCAAAMGVAIQRGSTCTVAALHDLVHAGRPGKLLALMEAAAWVGAGVVLAQAAGALPVMPTGHALQAWTLGGAALLGLGAWLNNACVIGTVARVGSGEWVYLATPVGFFVGTLSADAAGTGPPPPVSAGLPPLLQAPAWLGLLLVLAASMRLAWALRHHLHRLTAWTPHAATAAIGAAFVLLWLLAGAWSYTDVLTDLSHGVVRGMASGMTPDLVARLVLAGALLVGACAGGHLAGLWRPMRWNGRTLLRCLGGGLLMGWGTGLIPGSHDSLVLLGMPLLWPSAWVAFAVMALVISTLIGLARRAARRPPSAGGSAG